jgi:hypothetical protein
MGLLLCICLVVPCALVIRRRRRSGQPLMLPLTALVLLVIAGARSAVALRGDIDMVAYASDPSMKATLLAKGISEQMNYAAILIVVVLPLGVGGYFVDRWLIAHWKRRRTIG